MKPINYCSCGLMLPHPAELRTAKCDKPHVRDMKGQPGPHHTRECPMHFGTGNGECVCSADQVMD